MRLASFLWINSLFISFFSLSHTHTPHTHTHTTHTQSNLSLSPYGRFIPYSQTLLSYNEGLKSLLIHSIHSQTNFYIWLSFKATVLFPWLFNIISHGQKYYFSGVHWNASWVLRGNLWQTYLITMFSAIMYRLQLTFYNVEVISAGFPSQSVQKHEKVWN